ncbi:ferredoxin [Pseudonocardia asaccharolytica]|uniref:Ferredoxin n=1 Tax=Pseudonocardia asaccharolytica DSM 44247 = NBRC 16224 TaxID=1123024 RepID=A0A511D117_9PSEU|nr:ferredoxin [Pseudonocardia asaccharolytica]GEL16578.1 ferredoxin [Pseudonocardia asaccharolytica DSM 44247 = NBRC 16224]
MAYVVTDACVDVLDRSCVEECPVDCIYQGDRMMYIHPDECVDCGKCMPACPSDAIYWEHKIPDELAVFTAAAAEFVRAQQLGGGAADTSVGVDHPIVDERKPR